MIYPDIAKQLINIKNADLDLRSELMRKGELNDGYHKEMEALHNKNADILNSIIDNLGYPTITKVGKEGSEAAWLIIQHAISQPSFMKKCLKHLEEAVANNGASPIALAYLSDRIAVFSDKPQLYGTQFDWDEYGELSPQTYDDYNKVNERRKAIGLNTLEDQIEIIRKDAKLENHQPPTDLEARRKAYDKWRKEVGWIR